MKILSIIFILLFLGVLFICGSAIFNNTPPYELHLFRQVVQPEVIFLSG